MKCKYCGAEIPEGDSKCESCGRAVVGNDIKPQKKKIPVGWIIFAIVTISLIALGHHLRVVEEKKTEEEVLRMINDTLKETQQLADDFTTSANQTMKDVSKERQRLRENKAKQNRGE